MYTGKIIIGKIVKFLFWGFFILLPYKFPEKNEIKRSKVSIRFQKKKKNKRAKFIFTENHNFVIIERNNFEKNILKGVNLN